MSNATHTPGPWASCIATNKDRDAFDVVPKDNLAANGGYIIAACYGPDRIDNARLLAAAPAMLEALKMASYRMALAGYFHDQDKIKAVIAQAEGREVTQ